MTSAAYPKGFEVSGSVCVVTGGSSGIGRALCKKFAQEGARAVIVADIDEKDGQVTLDELNYLAVTGSQLAFNTKFIHCDVSKEENLKSLIDTVMQEFGAIDLFAANAGIVSAMPITLENFDQKVFDKVFAINTLHPIWAAKHLVPFWLKRKQPACFITTASAAGLLTEVQRLPYTVSKYGAVSFSEFMAINYGRQGINTICICPQAVATKMNQGQKSSAVVDGLSSADDLAQKVIEAMQKGLFFVCMPEQIKVYMGRKAADYDRWIKGMQRLRASL